MADKRYFWMRFQRDFFKSLRIKKLRRLAGGDTYTIIYLKMQLLSIVSEGYLAYKGVFDTFAEEIAEDIDEDLENVQVTITYLLSCGLMEQKDNKYFLPYAAENIGSECASAKRVREHRERQKALQCNGDVTEMKRLCNVEKEIDKSKSKNTFTPPTLEEIEAYCKERKNNVDPKQFYDYFTEGNWVDAKGQKVKNWKQKILTWEKFNTGPKPKKTKIIDIPRNEYDMDDLEKQLLSRPI